MEKDSHVKQLIAGLNGGSDMDSFCLHCCDCDFLLIQLDRQLLQTHRTMLESEY